MSRKGTANFWDTAHYHIKKDIKVLYNGLDTMVFCISLASSSFLRNTNYEA
jgi:hypothetical protein